MSEAIYIVSGARTPMGGLMGDLAPVTAPQLGSTAIKAAVERSGLDGDKVDEVFMGCVRIVDKLKSGLEIALISDAGTPAISDPGFLLTRACVDEGIAIECLPGATAFVPALVNSGLPNDRFVFEGFLPIKKDVKHV